MISQNYVSRFRNNFVFLPKQAPVNKILIEEGQEKSQTCIVALLDPTPDVVSVKREIIYKNKSRIWD